ncbi:MAG: UDP-N-acetylmuramate dehydrogenase [Gammaproteobacteria bacterium]|nr:UDP-N-acetylmuramate dehydrogenase [Gammaproteobacteria bacterium]MBL6898799.1 UDP-N-acetylmuramate dehydrogenase [Gammaproteobacteria bacterium]
MIKHNYPLKNITTIGLGGTCKELICPVTINDLLKINKSRKHIYVGNGSNICFITDYYNGSIISLKRMKRFISHDDSYIYCSSNISCNKVSRYLYNNKISGFEFLHGIPGTIGGAIYMNAGAFDDELLRHVHSIELLDSVGNNYIISNKDLHYSYRKSNIDKKSSIIRVTLNNQAKVFDRNILNKLNSIRKNTQPIKQLSCGCIFRNPKNQYAAKLIEGAELKGTRVGGIYISRKHSNYFINDGSGTYKEFLKLIKIVKNKVFTKYNIKLQEEVILVK